MSPRTLLRAGALAAIVLAALAPVALARGLYGVDYRSGAVFSIDTGTGALSRITVPPGNPRSFAISPDGSRAYMTSAEMPTGTVSVIDTATNTTIGQPIPVGNTPHGITISPDGRRAYVADEGTNLVSVIDTATGQSIGMIEVAPKPESIVIAPDGTRAYAIGAAVASPIDLRSGRMIGAPISLSNDSSDAAIAPDGSRVYVPITATGVVRMIDVADNRLLPESIEVGEEPLGIAISPEGRRAYVACKKSNAVVVIDTATGTVATRIGGIAGPEYVAVSPDGRSLYVGTESGAVAVVDAQTGGILGAPIQVGLGEDRLAVVPDQPPVASFSGQRARPGVPVALDASASRDPDGRIASYGWSFGDGQGATAAGPQIEHGYGKPGTYLVALTLTDNEGCSTSMVFTGQTASCNGSAVATTTRTVTVAYPGVRVACPRAARAKGCSFALQVFAAKQKPGGKAKPESAVAKARLKAGRAAIVSLRAKKPFRVKLARAKSVLVREVATIGGSRSTRFHKLKIVR
jgi:YVTN family beta-propeller protein